MPRTIKTFALIELSNCLVYAVSLYTAPNHCTTENLMYSSSSVVLLWYFYFDSYEVLVHVKLPYAYYFVQERMHHRLIRSHCYRFESCRRIAYNLEDFAFEFKALLHHDGKVGKLQHREKSSTLVLTSFSRKHLTNSVVSTSKLQIPRHSKNREHTKNTRKRVAVPFQ